MMNIAQKFIEHGAYCFAKTTLRGGRMSPYSAKFPIRPSGSFLEILEDRVVEMLDWQSWHAPYVIGIARSGLVLAQAVFQGLSRVVTGVGQATISPYVDTNPIEEIASDRTVIIVDNAVTTGKTIRWAHRMLQHQGIQPSVVVRFFDREEIGPDGVVITETLRDDMDLDLFSLFQVRDLIPDLSEMERQEVLNHLARFGTPIVQKYMEETYVFQNNLWAIRGDSSTRS